MTTIGQVLDQFFSLSTARRLWVMRETDAYTRIVRQWQPVIHAVNRVKSNLASDPRTWESRHRTSPSWTPGLPDPPVPDPHAYEEWVDSPPGTDSTTCGAAFVVYRTTGRQTTTLHTAAIGEFGIFVTVDRIDLSARTAQMKIWMYNSMDRRSFGPHARHFSGCGMARQTMWWNWSTPHRWTARGSAPGTLPLAPGGW